MSASVDAITSLKSTFPSVTDRPSSDCPAVNVPTGELISVLKSLRDEQAFDLLSDVTAIVNEMKAEKGGINEASLPGATYLGGIRGVLFANMGGASFDGQTGAEGGAFKWLSTSTVRYTPTTGFNTDAVGNQTPIKGRPVPISGLRLVDARGSYGVGVETFALGFPVHFDWSWRTLLNKDWEDALFAASGGSKTFRKPRFAMWIGYDF